MNLHKLAQEITLLEGKAQNLSIAQVKEVLKITLLFLKKMTLEELMELLKRQK